MYLRYLNEKNIIIINRDEYDLYLLPQGLKYAKKYTNK